MKVLALRLKPNQDLKESLRSFVEQQTISAGFIVTTVGSLKQAALRFAGQDTTQMLQERFEIVSLVGTLSVHGLHLHMTIADAMGKTIGGHVQPGCLIYTTAEVVLGVSEELTFFRTMDAETGFRELEIKSTR